jgi:hypothetical protein
MCTQYTVVVGERYQERGEPLEGATGHRTFCVERRRTIGGVGGGGRGGGEEGGEEGEKRRSMLWLFADI